MLICLAILKGHTNTTLWSSLGTTVISGILKLLLGVTWAAYVWSINTISQLTLAPDRVAGYPLDLESTWKWKWTLKIPGVFFLGFVKFLLVNVKRVSPVGFFWIQIQLNPILARAVLQKPLGNTLPVPLIVVNKSLKNLWKALYSRHRKESTL